MMWDKIFIALFSAAVAWFLQQYRIARSEDIVLINEHIKDLEKFSETAQAYWLLKPKKPEDDLAAAAKVRAAHAATTLLYSDICRICPQASASYTERSIALFDMAMGADFEGKGRGMDVQRAIQTHDIVVMIIHDLRKARSEIVSLKRLFTSCIEPLLPLKHRIDKIHNYFFI